MYLKQSDTRPIEKRGILEDPILNQTERGRV